MSNYAIEIENLSKRYYIGKINGPKTLQARLINLLTTPAQRLRALISGKAPTYVDEEFWALKDINLKIKQGESIGIIGRNGSGKSTLLQLVAHITTPTKGQVITRGSLTAMLNVGTGFHNELTGRENVYVNGAVLGKSVADIDRIYDDIVAFAEIEDFMDTPLKRYSSGMRVRLAFSVAIHIDPDIIILDEVLAVGDPMFREKCLEAMISRHEDTTVMIVSHNVHYLKRLCDRMIWMKDGEIFLMGDPDEIVKEYISQIQPGKPRQSASESDTAAADVPQDIPLSLEKILLLHPATGDPAFDLNSDTGLKIHLKYQLKQSLDRLRVTCHFVHKNTDLTIYACSDSDTEPRHHEERSPGWYIAEFQTPKNLFTANNYYVTVIFDDPETGQELARWDEALPIRVVDTRSTRAEWFGGKREGFVNYNLDWDYHLWAGDDPTPQANTQTDYRLQSDASSDSTASRPNSHSQQPVKDTTSS